MSKVPSVLSCQLVHLIKILRGVVLVACVPPLPGLQRVRRLRSLRSQIRDHASKRSAGHPSAPTTSSSRAAASARSNSPCSCCRWCAAGSSPSCVAAPRWMRCSVHPACGLDAAGNRRRAGPAYVFLRRVEHRIQYLDDQQTHVLPTRDDDLAWIASTLGYKDCCAFPHELDAHRELVAQEFDTLLGGNGKNNAAAAAVAAHGQRHRRPRNWKACWSSCRRAFASVGRAAQLPARGRSA